MIGYNKKKGCSSLHFQINDSSSDLSVHNSTRKMKHAMKIWIEVQGTLEFTFCIKVIKK